MPLVIFGTLSPPGKRPGRRSYLVIFTKYYLVIFGKFRLRTCVQLTSPMFTDCFQSFLES